jgi:hypothetical protein
MEEDSREILSPLLEKPQIQKQFELLEKVVDEAQKRVDYTVAHDPDVKKAIEVVERFLRKNHRICYGGQAINALLPRERQFYDPLYTVPDYDFFSPNYRADTDELVAMLEGAGFTDVTKKLSVHEGTIKIYVNFIPVADISQMPPPIFKILQRRAKVVEGISYCDPDFLRMLMYLELSRPRGEVARWKKVYERLTLLNDAFPVGRCDEQIRVPSVDLEDRKIILEFCLKHKRVVASSEIIELFETGQSKKGLESLVRRGGPVIFFSESAQTDAEDLKSLLSERIGGGIRVQPVAAITDQLYNVVTLKRRSVPLALLIQQDACHGYTTLRVDGQEMRLATPDLLLNLYYSFMLFGKKERAYFGTSLECLIEKIHSLLKVARNRPTDFLPAFGLRCSGRQKGLATLLKEKAERTDAEKKGITRKRNKNSKRASRKA